MLKMSDLQKVEMEGKKLMHALSCELIMTK